MHRKAIIITGCVLGVVAVLILLGVLLFGVKTIYVESYPTDCSPSEKSDVVSAAEYLKGQNILFLNEEKLIEKLRKNVPQLEVLGVERKFPSTVAIHVLRKFEYGFAAYDGGYCVVDNDLRILRKLAERPSGLIELSSDVLSITSASIGSRLETESGAFERIAEATFYALARIGYDVDDMDRDVLDLIDSIDISVLSAQGERISIRMSSGTILEIHRAETDRDLYFNKIRLAVTTYVRYDEYKGEGKKIIAITQDGKAVVYAQK